MSELSMKDRARIEATVHQIDQALGGRVPRKKRREIRDELRSNLTEAATNVGTEEAIRQLGDLPALISSYVEVYRGRWDPRTAFWAAIITYAVLVFLTLVVPHWPITGLAIGALILGIGSLIPVTFLWLARRIARMMRATIPAPPSVR
jgi:Flp pilus assembly protein TadB